MRKKLMTIIIMTLFLATSNIKAQSCDLVLEKCVKTVKSQQVVIKKQEKVVKNQNDKITLLEDRVKELNEENDKIKKYGLGSFLLTLLLIL